MNESARASEPKYLNGAWFMGIYATAIAGNNDILTASL